MCRLLCLLSRTELSIEELKKALWFGNHAIFKQCYKDPYTPDDPENPRNHHLNMDGYGIGHFTRPSPDIYTAIIPSWNDHNLFHLLPLIKTRLLMAHIRAIDAIKDKHQKAIMHSCTPVHQYNCHPFIQEGWLFCHNGVIESYFRGDLRKKIIMELDDDLLIKICGNSDSEYLGMLIQTFYRRRKKMDEALQAVVQWLKRLDPEQTISMNVALSNGETIFATRYLNHHATPPPSLYHFRNSTQAYISSEPLCKKTEGWALVPNNTLLEVTQETTRWDILDPHLRSPTLPDDTDTPGKISDPHSKSKEPLTGSGGSASL